MTYLVRMLIAAVCGGVIGMERGRANQAAGMRTYMLVCLGAAVVMMTGELLYEEYGTGDPARLGAQVVSGIGFLGAGSIITSGKMRIRGLTTAAGLWVSACIGLSIGGGYEGIGIATTILVGMTMTAMRKVESFFGGQICVYLEIDPSMGVEELSCLIEESGLVITRIRMNEMKKRTHKLMLQIKSGKKRGNEEILHIVRGLKGVRYAGYVS